MEGQDTRHAAAGALAARFIEAAASGSESAAEALCTPSGWVEGDSPARGLFMSIAKKGLVVDLMGEPRMLGSRAAQLAVLSHPRAPRPLGDIWILLERVADTWRIVGSSKLRNVVGLFLWDRVPGHVAWRTLPPSDRAEDWAAPVTASLHFGEAPNIGSELFQTRLEVDEIIITPLDSVELAAADRGAAGWRFTTPTDSIGFDVWVVLDLSTTPPEPIRALEFPGLETLLDGLDLDWPHEDPDEPGRALTPEERPSDPAGGAAVLEGLLRRSIAQSGVDPEGDGPEAEQARELLSFVHRMVPKGQPVPEPGTAARQVVLPPALQTALTESVQKLVDDGVAGPGELKVDRDFVENHGGALVGGLFAAVLGDALPPAVELTVPVETNDPDGPEVVKLTAEPRRLLEELMVPKPGTGDG